MPNNKTENELGSILNEINSGIAKDKEDNNAAKSNNNKSKANKNSKGKKNNGAAPVKTTAQNENEKANDIYELEDQQKFSFIENAKIIEEEPEKPEFNRSGLHKDEKFIEVSEITETDEATEKPDTSVLVELSAPLKTKEPIKSEPKKQEKKKSDKKEPANENTAAEEIPTAPIAPEIPQAPPKETDNKKAMQEGEPHNEREKKAEPSIKRQKADSDKSTATSAIPRNKQQPPKKTSKPQKGMIILGVFIAFFVIVGVVSTVWTGVKVTSNIINETELKEELAKELFPLVIVDIPAFDDPAKLDSSAIISSSIWEFIINEENKSKYKKDDLGSMYVPDVDIEKYVRALYGTEVKIVHQSVDDSTVQMMYDPEGKYYIIESTPKFLPYTPRVDKIIKTGDIYTLRVSYVLPDAMWNLSAKNKVQTVDKIMEYRIKKVEKSYQMLSVTLIEVTNNSQNMDANSTNENGTMPMEELEPIEPEPTESISEETAANAAVSGEATTSDTSSDTSGDTSSEASSTAE